MRTELLSFSATNRSPFGAVRITRGVFSPDATISMVKPGGTFGMAPWGIGSRFAEILHVLADRRLVGERQMPPQAGLVLLPVAEGGLSFQDRTGAVLGFLRGVLGAGA